jgi:hypothetical protein
LPGQVSSKRNNQAAGRVSGRADPPGPSHKMGNSRFQNGEHARCASSRPLCIVLRELRAHQQEEKALVMWSHVGSLMLRLTTRKFRELETRLAMSKRFIGGFGLAVAALLVLSASAAAQKRTATAGGDGVIALNVNSNSPRTRRRGCCGESSGAPPVCARRV